MATDPVCGMEISPDSAAASAEFEGTTYFFCSEDCKDSFLREPGRYLTAGSEQGKKGLLGRLFRRS
ncbi:MAG: YHS domain-containing protein [Actinobacteria bacterium]|nr:YHS domain-containing protein [Actinomycetota bacterium]